MNIARLSLVLACLIGLLACALKPVEEPKVGAKWVEQVSADHNRQVLKCYELALKKDKTLKGNIVLEINATTTGHVSSVKVVKGIAPELDGCVLTAAKGWVFPWINIVTAGMQDRYELSLDSAGQPISKFTGPRMDKDYIHAVIDQNMPEVRKCYMKAWRHQPDLEGQVVMTWDILGSGEVTSVKVAESLDSDLDRCIIGKIRTWKFPSPPNMIGANVKHAFVLTVQ